jgi:hypothetical protein
MAKCHLTKIKVVTLSINSFFLPICETHLTARHHSVKIDSDMGKKVTYERWINLFLPDGWNEREEMGYILLEKEGWLGMVQLSFIERENTNISATEAARILLEDTLEERDIPFPREAIKTEDRGDMGIATLDYAYKNNESPTHWRIWFLVDKTRALMAAYISSPEDDHTYLEETCRIIADIEFIPSTND